MDSWKENFIYWLNNDRYINLSTAKIIADHAERYIRPKFTTKESVDNKAAEGEVVELKKQIEASILLYNNQTATIIKREQEIESLKEGLNQPKEDAVEFAEWIVKDWSLYEGETKLWHETMRVSKPKTTEQLYSLFKQGTS